MNLCNNNLGAVSSGTQDFNSFTQGSRGSYFNLDSEASQAHAPSGAGNYVTATFWMNMSNSGHAKFQISAHADNALYYRWKDSAHDWSSWKRISVS